MSASVATTQRRQPVAPSQRHTRANPCIICGGYDSLPRGKGMRCIGFRSEDGAVEHCTREEYAGGLTPTNASPPTYVHRLSGTCACGQRHDAESGNMHNLRARPEASGRSHTSEIPEAERGQIWSSYRDIPRGMFIPVRGDDENRDGKPRGNKVRWARVHHTAQYVDEQGVLFAELWRYEVDAPDEGMKPAKLVLPRAPLSDGRWIGSLNGRGLPLYNLPRLQSARLDALVFVTEGEKKADQLQAALDEVQAEGVVVSAAFGAKGWHRAVGVESALKQRRIAILPDNDDDGRGHADSVRDSLAGVAADVRIVHLPGLGGKEDIADWLQHGGTVAELMRIVEETPAESTAPGDSDGPDVPEVIEATALIAPFPLAALTPGASAFVEQMSDALQCPLDLVGLPVLGALSVAIGTTRVIEVTQEWEELPVLYLAIVGEPGDSKSPAINKALQVLYDADDAADREYRRQLRAWKQQAEAPGVDPGPQPLYQQIVVDDVTIEALVQVLQANPRGVIQRLDELSGLMSGMNQYRGGKGRDKQYYLQMWSKTPIVVNRRADGSEPRRVSYPFVSLIGGIQPDMLSSLADKGKRDGFLDRILFAWAEPVPQPWREPAVNVAVKERYSAMIQNLLMLSHATDGGEENTPNRTRFDIAAKRAWAEWITEHREERQCASFPAYLKGPWRKFEAYAARLALILHMARVADGDGTADPDWVDERSVTSAVTLIEYFKSHARRVYARLLAHPEDLQVEEALKWLHKQPGPYVTARQVQQAHVAGLRTSEDAKLLLSKLQQRGYGIVEEVASQRGRPSFRFYLSERQR